MLYSIHIHNKIFSDTESIFKRYFRFWNIIPKYENDYILSYFIFQHRIIPRKPRKILKAKEFVCPPEFISKLEFIENIIKTGKDLTPFLSRGVMDCRRDDLMLYDWGIHHLHISNERDNIKNDGFMKRSNLLLYVYFDVTTAYFLMTINHSGDSHMWVKKQCFEIIHSNWPKLLGTSTIYGIESVATIPDEDDLKKLRNIHINSLVDLSDGTFVVSNGGGYASEGTSNIAVLKSLDLKKKINAVAYFLVQNKDNIINSLYDKNKLHDIPFNIRLSRIDRKGIYVTLNYNIGLLFDYNNYCTSKRYFSTCEVRKIFCEQNCF